MSIRRDTRKQDPIDEIYVKVIRTGRFTYDVRLNSGDSILGMPVGERWMSSHFGRARAERVAQRLLEKELRDRGYRNESAVIFREQR